MSTYMEEQNVYKGILKQLYINTVDNHDKQILDLISADF
jgi:hypothetical protein